jgi:Asp-tRNA(Asn)/Glu-tRNA(Gln) amidotransferase A subunit family amidase
MAGLPGFSFCTGYAEMDGARSLPVGLQLVGPRWSDKKLLDIGFELEKILGVPKIAQGNETRGN